MSKGLIALRKLQRGQYGTREQFNNQLSIIEKELKEKEEIVEVLKKCPQIGDILDWAEQYDEVNNTCIYGLLKDVLL